MERGLIERLCIWYINSRRNDSKFISRLTNRVRTIVNNKHENGTMRIVNILNVMLLAIVAVFIVYYWYIEKNHTNWCSTIVVFIMVCLSTLIPMKIHYLLINLNRYLQTINKK